MIDVSDKWTCHRCNATWTRDVQPESEWRLTIRTVQQKHGLRCGATVTPARFDERYDPSPEPIDRRIS